MAILGLYLTSLEPDINQTILSQSIGGYRSNSLLYPETILLNSAGLYDTSLTLETPSSGNWLDWQGEEYINIGNEVIKVSAITNGSITVSQRGYNGIINMHLANDTVRASSSKELFNDVFNDERKQYRCLALKNISASINPSGLATAYDISVYLKQNSRNPNADVRVSIEQPASQYIAGTSTSWNTIQIIDTSLIGKYSDKSFKGAYLKITGGGGGGPSGQGKIVNSFDSATGIITLVSSFSAVYDYTQNVTYEILPAPAQRIKTGDAYPIYGGDNVLPFYSPTENTDMSFITVGSDPVVSDLYPNDLIYIWLERTIEKGVAAFSANDIVLNFKYKESQ